MRPVRLSAVLLALTTLTSAAFAAAPQFVRAPFTRAEVVRDTLHGTVIEDPYRWLEDKDSPATRAWLAQQRAYTKHLLGQVEDRDSIRAIVARFQQADTRGAPVERGTRLFYSARRADQQLASLVMKDGGAPEVTLIDPAAMDTTLGTNVSILDVSQDGRRLLYAVRKGGEDEVEARLFDIDARKDLPGGLPRARYLGIQFSHDQKGAYYSRYDASGPRVRYHLFSQPVGQDALLFGEGLTAAELPTIALSDDGRWLVITVRVGSTGDDTRLYLKNVQNNGKVITVADQLKSTIQADVAGDSLYVLTNWQAPNGRVVITKLSAPRPENWRDVVPERKDVVLESMALVGGQLYVRGRQNVASRLYAYGPGGESFGEVVLPGPGSIGGVSGRWNQKNAYYSYSAFNHPPAILRLDTAKGAAEQWWRSPVKFDPNLYDVRQFNVRSSGNAKVLFYVVSRKGIEFNGQNPTLMSGYGGFNQPRTSSFSATVAAWLELGGVYVSTNLRGGNEFGEAWHKDGMLANKQHTFDDFLAVAQWLIGRGYCYPAKLGIIGGSNGGLLVGAAMTQRPDLFGAVICSVPLLDMLRYHKFLVARLWVPEYGSSENAEQFQWLKAYSPYHRVQKGTKYPAMMLVSGDSDTRVDPLHARKMTALMQSVSSEQLALLHYDVASGHSGGKAVEKSIEDSVDNLQFLRWKLGMLRP